MYVCIIFLVNASMSLDATHSANTVDRNVNGVGKVNHHQQSSITFPKNHTYYGWIESSKYPDLSPYQFQAKAG